MRIRICNRIRASRSARFLLVGAVIAVVTGCATSGDFGKLKTPDQWREAMQPPLSATETQALADGPTLNQSIQLALMRNPGVEAARQRWLAAIYREPQAGSLPDPMISAGYQFRSVETRVGPQQGNFGLMQALPWWQKLWARGQVASTQSDIARLKYDAAARDLIVDVKDACYELAYLDQALTITEGIESLLRNEGLLAYSELESGRTQLGEAFKAESQAAQLGYDRLLLAEQRAAQAERLRSLLNLPPETPIGSLGSMPVYPVCDTIGPLYERAEAYAQVLGIRGLEIEKSEYDTYLAKLSRIPDISLGLNVISTGAAAMGGVAESGKDAIIGLFSMNLPIWEQRNRALIHEKEAVEESMKREALEETNRVRKAVAGAFFQERLTGRLVQLYADTLLPQAQAVMQRAESYYRADQSSFSGVLETTMAYHNFLLAYHRAQADHGQAIGRLERVLGTTAEARDASVSAGESDEGGQS